MSPSDVFTLLLAAAGFVIAMFSLVETKRQGRAAIRPLLVFIEKRTDNRDPNSKYSLYLVNMGQAAALNVEFDLGKLADTGGEPPNPQQSVIAAGRKALLSKDYESPMLAALTLKADYSDLNGKAYTTEHVAHFRGAQPRHVFTQPTKS